MGRMKGDDIVGLERQIRGKLRSQQEVSALDNRITNGMRAIQLLADAFRETVNAMNADFEALKARVAKLEAPDGA